MAFPAPIPLMLGRSLRCWALFAFAVSVVALGLAYVSEYFFGLHPCTMCYWQRVPYGVVIVLALAAYFLRAPKVQAGLLWLSVLLFAGGALLAAFHAGVEWRWWEGPTTCSGGVDGNLNPDELLARIMNAPAVSCTDAAIRVLGLSMAGWNALYSAGTALVLAVGLQTRKAPQA